MAINFKKTKDTPKNIIFKRKKPMVTWVNEVGAFKTSRGALKGRWFLYEKALHGRQQTDKAHGYKTKGEVQDILRKRIKTVRFARKHVLTFK